MKDKNKTKAQLIKELELLRQRVAELEASAAGHERAEEALTQERSPLRMVIDNLPDRIYVKDIDHRFVISNVAHARYLGVTTPDELVGKTASDYFPPELDNQYLADERQVIRSGQPLINFEEPSKDPVTGEMRWVLSTKVPLRDEQGEVVGLVGINRDITERKRAEEALERRMEQLAGLNQASQAVTSSLEPDQVLEEIMSLAGEVTGSDYTSVAIVDEEGELFQGIETLPGLPPLEHRVRPDGIQHWITRLRQPVIVDEVAEDGTLIPWPGEGAPCSLNPIVLEIGIKSFAGLPLIAKDRLLGVLYLHSFQPYHFHDQLPLLSTFANQAAIAIENARLFASVEAQVEERTAELVMANAQLQQEIAERERVEEALAQERNLLRTLIDNMPDYIYIKDTESQFIVGNTGVARVMGATTPDELIGKTDFDFYPRELAAQYHADEQEVVRSGQPLINREEPITDMITAEEGWTLTTKVPLRDSRGEIVGLVGVGRDITKRRRAEEALAAEKERLAVTLRSIGDGVISTDAEGRVVLINKVAEKLTGWPQEETVGKPLSEVFHIINEKTRQRRENPVDKVLETGRIVGLANHTILIARDGTERVIADSGAPIRDKDSNVIGVVLVFRDITEKRKMEEELLKAQKLESVGILAGGIAHDFNNILTAVIGNISFAKINIDAEDAVFETLTVAEKAALRARDLTRQLLTFARGGTPVKKTASIGELIKDSASFALRGSNVRCEFSLPNNLWPVEVDEGQVSQVVNNLVINADQAMPEGGIVRVCAENMTVSAADALPLKSGRFVRISVEDQGIGIPAEHLPKIFDPYFTTKQMGSGLGLAISYSIIKNHDGLITAESALGVGTTFYIYLPASRKKIPPKKVAEERPLVGKGRILVMDDEEMVRDVAGRMLSHIGYDVEFARDGIKAIELYKKARESGNPFDVVIMDLTVPGAVGGKEAIKKLIETDPEVKAIVSSGYSTDPIMSDFRDYGFSGVIAKPYDIEELSETLRKVITGE